MKSKFSLLLALALAVHPPVFAADAPSKDTISVVPEGATPDDIVGTIALPAKATDRAREQAKKGLDTANAAKENRGKSIAAEAREQGREFGKSRSEEARENNPSAQIREAASDARSDNASERRPPPKNPK